MAELEVCGATGVYIDPPETPSGDCDCDEINYKIQLLNEELEATKSELAYKQDVLSAGENITIENGVISSEDTKYTAGNNVTISDGKITVDLSSYYNKTEVNNLFSSLDKARIEIVDELPATGETNVIYFVKNDDIYDEYVYINGEFVKIGDTRIDLSEYATKEELNNVTILVNEAKTQAEEASDKADEAKNIATNALQTAEGKQNKLTAGSHIEIADDGTISVIASTKEEILETLGYEEVGISMTDVNGNEVSLTVLALAE